MRHAAPPVAIDGPDIGYAEHLLVWSWRRIAMGRSCCPMMLDRFAEACGEDGPDVFVTFCTFLKALAIAGRRQLMIGAPGCATMTADERRVLTLVAAAQAGTPALLDSHLCWIATAEKRHILEIATGALARAFCVNELHLTLPVQEMPIRCQRPRAVA